MQTTFEILKIGDTTGLFAPKIAIIEQESMYALLQKVKTTLDYPQDLEIYVYIINNKAIDGIGHYISKFILSDMTFSQRVPLETLNSKEEVNMILKDFEFFENHQHNTLVVVLVDDVLRRLLLGPENGSMKDTAGSATVQRKITHEETSKKKRSKTVSSLQQTVVSSHNKHSMAGLVGPGSLCYINSTLQALSHIEPLTNAFQQCIVEEENTPMDPLTNAFQQCRIEEKDTPMDPMDQ